MRKDIEEIWKRVRKRFNEEERKDIENTLSKEMKEGEIVGWKGLLRLLEEKDRDFYEKLSDALTYSQLIVGKSLKLIGSGEYMLLLPLEFREKQSKIKDIDLLLNKESDKHRIIVLLLGKILGKKVDVFGAREEVILKPESTEAPKTFILPFGEIFTDINSEVKEEERKNKLRSRLNLLIKTTEKYPYLKEDIIETAAKAVAGRIRYVYKRNKRARQAIFQGLKEDVEDAPHLSEKERAFLREVYRRAEKYL